MLHHNIIIIVYVILNIIIYLSALPSLRLLTQINWSAMILISDPGFALVITLLSLCPCAAFSTDHLAAAQDFRQVKD
jgi:hypothetical protein